MAPAALAGALILAGCGTPSAAPAASQQLTLSPPSGPPGTRVVLSGYLPAMRDATAGDRTRAQFGGDIGFGGFTHGLDINVSQIHWSARHPGHFAASFRVPATAWLTPTGMHRLVPGRYTVAIRCFGAAVQKGCGGGPDQLQSTFTLAGPVHGAPAHAFMALSPTHASPGQTVHVTGWAPLTNIIGQPFGYSLAWGNTASVATIKQSLSGQLSGTFQVPAYTGGGAVSPGSVTLTLSYVFMGTGSKAAGGGGTVSLAPTPFRVTSGLSWDELRSSPAHLSAAPDPLSVLASTRILLADNSTLWAGPPGALRAVPLAGITSQAAHMGYAIPGPHASVVSAQGVGAYPASLFIAVATASPHYGAPPVYYSPFDSTNGGATWQPLPVPHGMTFENFAGFRVVGARVYALWASRSGTATEVTVDGGQAWSTATLPCPPAGACLMLGPGPTGDPGMGAPMIQTVWRQNRGRQWTQSTEGETADSTMQLATLANGQALLIDSQSPYPVQMSPNGGQSWDSVALPNPPGITAADAAQPFQNLVLLQNGTLLGSALTAQDVGPVWYALPVASNAWRPVPPSVLPSGALGLTPAGGRLWWYELGTAGAASTVHSVSDGSL